MTKVVIKESRRGRVSKGSVVECRLRDKAGRLTTLRIVNAESPTLSADLHYVFCKNVAKARRENRRIIGRSDVAPAKD